jgi:hypothetical protein
MRVWLEILREKHPGVTRVAAVDASDDDDLSTERMSVKSSALSRRMEATTAVAA